MMSSTSKHKGSFNEPGSLARSRTAIFLTVFGSTFKKYLLENGLYKWTSIKPSLVLLKSKNYFIVSQTEPIATITYLAFGSP